MLINTLLYDCKLYLENEIDKDKLGLYNAMLQKR